MMNFVSWAWALATLYRLVFHVFKSSLLIYNLSVYHFIPFYVFIYVIQNLVNNDLVMRSFCLFCQSDQKKDDEQEVEQAFGQVIESYGGSFAFHLD